MTLSEVYFQPPTLGETTPPSTAVNGTDRVIHFPVQDMPSSDIVLYLRSATTLYAVYILLGLFGVILGLVGSPKIPQNRAGLMLLVSLVGFAALVFVAFGVLTPEQRMLDTTTVVTIGTVSGVCMAGIFGAGHALWAARRAQQPPRPPKP
jgi:hypothetical protein